MTESSDYKVEKGWTDQIFNFPVVNSINHRKGEIVPKIGEICKKLRQALYLTMDE